jgi:tetratricopeptide (TPR) repeat protein
MVGGYLAAPERSYFPELSAEAVAELADPRRRLALAQQRLGDERRVEVTLEKTIALSLEDLPADVRAAFHALGAFAPKPASFDQAAAQAVAGTDARTLALLIARNLLEKEGDALALHQTIADVARTATPDDARAAHRRHYLDRVDKDREDWQTIESLYPQVRWAWQQLAGQEPENKDLLQFVWTLRTYQERQGVWQDKIAWATQGLKAAQAAGDDASAASMLVHLGFVCDALGEKQQALGYYEQALPLFRAVGDRRGEATTLSNIGAVYSSLGEQQQALDYYEQALPLFRAVSDRSGEASTLNNIGSVYDALGEKEEALAYYEQALPLLRAVGDRSGEASTLNNMALIYYQDGDLNKAAEMLTGVLAVFQSIGAAPAEAMVRRNLAVVQSQLGQLTQAIDHIERSVAILTTLGLTQDAAGQTLDQHRSILAQLQAARSQQNQP